MPQLVIPELLDLDLGGAAPCRRAAKQQAYLRKSNKENVHPNALGALGKRSKRPKAASRPAAAPAPAAPAAAAPPAAEQQPAQSSDPAPKRSCVARPTLVAGAVVAGVSPR